MIKRKSLQRALELTGCRELPKLFNENGVDFWMEAIALVKKRNGSTSYCLVSHDPDGMIRYIQDLGDMSPIYSLLSVHPYKVLDKNRYGFFMSDVEFRSIVLDRGYTSEEIDALTEAQKDALRISICIERQEKDDIERQEAAKVSDEEDYLDEDEFADIITDTKALEKLNKENERPETIVSDLGVVEEIVDLKVVKKRGRPSKKNS